MTTLRNVKGSLGIDPDSQQVPSGALEGSLVQWLEWCRDRRGRSLETIRSYASTASDLVGWLGARDLTSVTRAELEGFLERPRPRGGQPAPNTVKREVATMRSFFRWCEQHELVERSVADGLFAPKTSTRNPRPVDDQTWQVWWHANMPDALRVAVGLGFYVGLRRAELVALTPSMVTDTTIDGFIRKGGGEHTIPWREMQEIITTRLPAIGDPDDLLGAALTRQQAAGGTTLLGWPCSEPIELNRRVRKWGERHGLPMFTPHQLRHSAATNLLRAGVPIHLVASLLSHSSPSVTMVYVKAGGDQLREWRLQQR